MVGALTNLGDVLAWQGRVRPRSIAIVDGAMRLDFETLARRVNRLAGALVCRRVGRGDRVAIQMAGSHRHFECLFACARLGATLMPINARAQPDELAQILAQTASALRFDSESAFESALEAPARESESAGTLDDPLLIMHTSGTTGAPKGVVLTQSNIIYSCFNQILGWQLRAQDRALVVAPLHHVGGLVALGLPTLYAGGAIHLVTPAPDPLLDAIAREQITALFLPPTLWTQVAHSKALDNAVLSSVRLCASGGDPLPVPILEHLIARFQAEFTDAYGLTEAASAVTLLRGDQILQRTGSAGTALAHSLIRIVDAHGERLTPGASGEIALAGPAVMKEYWRNPEATATALRDGWLHTGDRGYLDNDGFLYVAGRAAEAMVSGGREVFPSEIERVAREHSAVAEAAAFEIEDAQGGRAIAIAVVASSGTGLAPCDILDFCIARLPTFQRPQAAFILDSLPRNGSGKVVRSHLRARCEAMLG